MKSFKYLLSTSIVVLFLMPIGVVAQDNDLSREQISDRMNQSDAILTKSVTKTIGSPYLINSFMEGDMLMSNGTRTQTVNLRYNMEKNQVEFKRGDEVLATDTKKIDGFRIFTTTDDIIFKNGYNPDVKEVDENSLLRVAYDGDVKLMVRHKAVLKEDVPSYGSATTKNKYDVSEYYYLVTADGKFHQLNNPKRDLLEALPNNTELESYASSNNLNFKNEFDLIKILEHYDNLEE